LKQSAPLLTRSPKLFVGFFMLLIFVSALRPITDPDFWWHLKTGEYIVTVKSIPRTDIFSTLRFGSEWVTHEWLSEVLMYVVFSLMGYGGLIVAFAGVITLAFGIAYRQCASRTPHVFVAAFALLLGAAATIPTWGVRPQMFSLLFASIFLAVLDKYCRGEDKRLIWWLVPLMTLWANMHAGFAIGLVFIGLTILGIAIDELILHKRSVASIWTSIRELCLLWLIAATAVIINPNGLRLYSYPFETLRSSVQMRYIQEWRPPNFQDPMFLPLLILILVLLCVLAFSKKRPRPSEMIMLLIMLAATLRSARNVPFFALVAIPVLAGQFWSWLSAHDHMGKASSKSDAENKTRALVLNLLLIVVPLILCVFVVRRTLARQPQVEAENFPVAAVDFVKSQNVPQPIYNEYHWGGYLIWKLYPQYKVYMDGRADVYGDALIEEFFTVHEGRRSWRKPLDSYGIRTVLVEPDTPIATLLREDSAWQNVFEDKQAVIFVRSDSWGR
jgi:hypothetical protein